MLDTKVLYPLDLSIQYLEKVLQMRLESYFNHQELPYPLQLVPRPEWNGMRSAFTDFVAQQELNDEAFIILLIALVPHLQLISLIELSTNTYPNPETFHKLVVFAPKIIEAFFQLEKLFYSF